jgi:peptidyl-prolyl cis-trans isomerase B (cyclophilin B)
MEHAEKNPVAVIKTRLGDITVELYPDQAPNAVGAFIWVAKEGLFDRRRICRVVPGFVVQPSYSDFEDPRCAITLNGEYESNGIHNAVPFRTGTVAMGGEGKIASGSCFFFTLTDEAGKKLDGKFTAFGTVTDGWDVVEQIAALPLRPVENDLGVEINEPMEEIDLDRVEVETWGREYPFQRLS